MSAFPCGWRLHVRGFFVAVVAWADTACSPAPLPSDSADVPRDAGQHTAGDAGRQDEPAYPVAWSAIPDPQPAEPAPVTASFPISLGEASHVIFPRVWPPLALATQRGVSSDAEVFDLSTGASLGSVQSREMFPPELVVSPDGTRMAGKLLKTGRDHIRIWSLKTGRVDGDHVLVGDGSSVSFLRFAGADQLLAFRRDTSGSQVVVMDLGQATPPRTFRLTAPRPAAQLRGQEVGVSRGGKYLAALVGDALVVHEIATGQCVGTADLPEAAADFGGCKELVFSPDGRSLATLVTTPDGQSLRLWAWDFTTGELVQDTAWGQGEWQRSLSGFVSRQDAHPLAWLPDGSGWVLYGRLVWKRGEASPEPDFEGDDQRPRCVLDGERVVAVARGSQGGLQLVVVPRLGTELADSPATGEQDTGLPQPGSGWKAAVDPGSVRLRPMEEPLAFFGALSGSICFPQRPGRHGACLLGEEYVVFDLEAGRETQRFRAENPQAIYDVSPDGRYLATAALAADMLHVEVWNIATGQVAFRFEETVTRAERRLEFIGPARLLFTTRNRESGQRRYSVWDVDSQQQSHEFLTSEGRGGYLIDFHLVSPGGRLAVALFHTTLAVYDLASGTPVGETRLSSDRSGPRRVHAVMPIDGRHLHLLAHYHEGTPRLFSVDMADGRVTDRPLDSQQLAEAHGEVRSRQTPWVLDDAAWLLEGQSMVNAASGAVVGPLGLEDGAVLIATGQDRLLLGSAHQRHTPAQAMAILPMTIEAQAARRMASVVEQLRPAPVAEVPAPPAVTEPLVERPAPGTEAPPAAGPAPDAVPEPDWKPMVDPPHEPRWEPARRLADDLPSGTSYISCSRGGPALLVVQANDQQARVLNLATGQVVGEPFALPRSASRTVVSPQGDYVALQSERNELMFVEVATGKATVVPLARFTGSCQLLAFTADDHVLAVFRPSDDRLQLQRYLPSGEDSGASFSLPICRHGSQLDTTLAISPGGNHLAVLQPNQALLCDLNDRSVQTVALPFPPNSSPTPVSVSGMGLSFSPDGGRLAAGPYGDRHVLMPIASWRGTQIYRKYGFDCFQWLGVPVFAYHISIDMVFPRRRPIAMLYQRSHEIERRLEKVLGLVRTGRYSTPKIAEEIGVSIPTIS